MKFYKDGHEISRSEAVEYLLKTWGNKCMYPGCTLPFDSAKHGMTIDHHYPQVRAREDGWEEESIHGIDNLRLMGKSCNSKKSDFIIDEEGKLPSFDRPKRMKVIRPDLCRDCNNGRLVYPGEHCDVCGSGPRPMAAPGVFKRKPKQCSHTYPEHCALCWAVMPELRVHAELKRSNNG